MSESEDRSFEFKRYVWNHPEHLRARNRANCAEKCNELQNIDNTNISTVEPFPLIGPGGVREVIVRNEKKKQEPKRIEAPKHLKKVFSLKPIYPRMPPGSPVTEHINTSQRRLVNKVHPQRTPPETPNESTQRILLTSSHFV